MDTPRIVNDIVQTVTHIEDHLMAYEAGLERGLDKLKDKLTTLEGKLIALKGRATRNENCMDDLRIATEILEHNARARLQNSKVKLPYDVIEPLKMKTGKAHELFPLSPINLYCLNEQQVDDLFDAYKISRHGDWTDKLKTFLCFSGVILFDEGEALSWNCTTEPIV